MKSYEEQRKELEARVSESEEAVLRVHSMRRNVEHLVRKEQAAFDALLKNPDFQRWLREAWETCRKSSRQEREAQPRQCCGEQGKCEDCRKDEAPMPKTEHTHTSACDNPSNCPTGNAYAKAAPMQKTGHHPKCHTVLMAGKDAWPACTCATIAKTHPDDQKTGLNTVRDAAGNPRQPQNVYTCCGMPATGTHAPCCPNHTAPAAPARPPALSPRQTLGEAVAAVERANVLLNAVRVNLSGGSERACVEDVLRPLGDVLRMVRAVYEAAK